MMDPITYLIHGERPAGPVTPVNPPLMRASTILFDSLQTWRETRSRRQRERVLSYGARGTETGFALERMVTTLEGGHRCQLFPTGLAAIGFTIMGYARTGGHVLFSDAVYEPVRKIAACLLRPNGIDYDFFRADGADVEQKIRANTQLIFAESPGSLLYEMVDLPALCRLAHARDIPVAVDNTWGSAFLYHPLRLGADVSVIAATKYLGGHSDVMMGMMVASERAWSRIGALPEALGQSASPDDAALVLRGMRTLALRMTAHGAAALRVARWLQGRPEVARVHSPALPDHPGHALWQRDCSGSNGLLTLEFAARYSQRQADAFIDALTLFGIGASWGGFESLVLPANVQSARSVVDWHSGRGPYVRLHIGLESVDDLIADLQQAFSAL
ncbi:cystathionine beta-lyase [Edwardsiella piscicida]|uniref:cystathionine beta-lyase n=1 Tax=Edwardsiella piscicida TaxID=1263550 RepID=UPI0005A29B8D|nr:cystathionine beta-lyase [Edwardsiella piscicida]EKS7778818.1 cystathionine beta-lyase [Edwardsiella piscicida]EKS7782238.1 cystathionine beta-lyase [Edwardsiella piscicida]EKS7792056.1 cystathionine beta-lyase [Edwardsiella piscicida]ELM3728081.1 cystathionine beta-lyase [Edwardsiella piscicida]ELV7536291.1 cystathionine beta-lyase [Edwardsiella piscicida]